MPPINSKTERLIKLYVQKPSHGLIVHAPKGSGGQQIVQQLITDSFASAHVNYLVPAKQSIGIEQAREALSFLRIKTADHEAKRVLVIANAELLTEEAQNALLKTLEEPAANNLIIFTTEKLNQLLPTIQSRSTIIEVLPLTLDEAKKYFSNPNIDKLYGLSEGYAELLQALANDEQHSLKNGIELAKTYLKSSLFERIKAAETMKDTAEELIDSIIKIAKSTLIQKDIAPKQRQSWINIYESATDAKQQLDAYVGKKTILLNLALNLSQV